MRKKKIGVYEMLVFISVITFFLFVIIFFAQFAGILVSKINVEAGIAAKWAVAYYGCKRLFFMIKDNIISNAEKLETEEVISVK